MPARPHILVVGTGSIGERHVRCFLNIDRVDVSVCELDASLRKEIAGRYDLRSTYGSLEDALREPLDAAVICTPANLHVSMATQIVQKGMHVLIEKPLGVDLDGGWTAW